MVGQQPRGKYIIVVQSSVKCGANMWAPYDQQFPSVCE